MKLEFDPETDTVYLELIDIEVEASKEVQPGVILDYDLEGRVVGIELLHTRQQTNEGKQSVPSPLAKGRGLGRGVNPPSQK